MLEEAAQADAAEDEQYRGGAAGDELPVALADRDSRLRAASALSEKNSSRKRQTTQAAYEANLALAEPDWEAEHGRKLGGREACAALDPEALAKRPRVNTTDPDTRLMRRDGGRSVQGYNVQVVASPEQIIPGRPGHTGTQ